MEDTMSQETMKEFANRLRQAVEAHPLAPPTPHGRQSWLIQLLDKQGSIKVSANTAHKWFHGNAKPRDATIRALAKVLKVDEVWLALGRKPSATPAETATRAVHAEGATLILAGAIEMAGGRVAFPASTKDTVSLWANIGSSRVGVIVVVAEQREGAVSFVVPEPVGDHRVLAVLPGQSNGASASFDFVDITDVPREYLGGLSVVSLERRGKREFKSQSQRALIRPLDGIADLAAA